MSDTSEFSYILIRKGTTLTNIEEINNAKSIESQLSRSRGGGQITNKPQQNNEGDFVSIGQMDFYEGRLTTETSYFMHFVDEKERRKLTLYDIIALPQIRAYPVNQETLDSLPSWAKSTLEKESNIKIRANYDSTTKKFNNVHNGWEETTNPFDQIMELAAQLDGNITQAAYYLAQKHGSEKWSNPTQIASIKDIKPKTVVESKKKTKKELSEHNKQD